MVLVDLFLKQSHYAELGITGTVLPHTSSKPAMILEPALPVDYSSALGLK